MAPRVGLAQASAPEPQEAAIPAAANAGAGDELETVTVTSTRRAQNIQDVPATVTAISGALMDQEHLNNSTDIAGFAPNTVAFNFDGRERPRYYIRGIGNGNVADNAVGAVAIYIDEVYLNSLAFQGFPLFDLSRVEVLNGPQGTLWGKNATAGAIQFVSERPTFTTDGYAQVEFGDYGQKNGELVANVPIVEDKLAARLSLRYEDMDGWATNSFNDKESGNYGDLAGRFQLLFKPSDDVDIVLNLHGRDFQGTRVPFYSASATTPSSLLVLAPRGLTDSNVDDRQSLESYGGSINITWRLPDELTLNSITAIEDGERREFTDTDNTASEFGRTRVDTKPLQVSQEVRLSSSAEQRLSWVTGVYYFHEYLSDSLASAILPPGVKTVPPFLGAPAWALTRFDQTTDSTAVFGNVTFKITDDLKISGGLRWTDDQLSNNLLALQATGPVAFFNSGNWWLPESVNAPETGIASLSASKSWSKVNYEVEPQYDITPDQQLYARVASGYRSGNFNTQITPNPAVPGSPPLQGPGIINPETLTSYEAGYKSSWFDNHLIFNIDGFYDDYDNIQVSYTATNPATRATIIALANAASGKTYGSEISIQALPVHDLVLSGNFGILNTDFTAFTGPTTAANLSGNQFARAPHLTASVGADYGFDLPWGDASIGTHWDYTGKYYYLVSNETAPALSQSGYFLGDIHASFHPTDSQLEFSGIVNNVSDTLYKNQVLPYSATTKTFSYSYGAPITFLLTARYNFASVASPSPAAQQPAAPPPATAPAPAPQPEAQREFQVFFDFDKSSITDAASRVIQAAADVVRAGGVAHITVTGHTDTVGTARYNQGLSERRAASVKSTLVSDGVNGGEISTVGIGKTGLLVPTKDGVREPQNRRAVIDLQ